MIVVDTGPLVAIVDADDTRHSVCLDWLRTVRRSTLLIPVAVLGEACHLIGARCGPKVETRFLEDLALGAYGTLAAPGPAELRRAAQLTTQYGDLPLGGVDALVLAAAEHHGAAAVATLDRRHFTIVQTARPLDLVPAL